MAQLAGLTAFVTGGSRGIGRAIAAALTQAGARVTIAGRSADSLSAALTAGEAAEASDVDVTQPGALTRVIGERRWDILVNNAGGATGGSFERQDRGAFEDMLAQHALAPAEAMRAVLPGMKARGFGRIVNIASTAGLHGFAGVSSYVTAKHALVGLTRAVASETARTGVTVNAVCPGYTETEMLRAGMAQRAARSGADAETVFAAFAASQPLGRLVRPEEVAAAVVWLCGRDSGAVTGQAIVIDAEAGS